VFASSRIQWINKNISAIRDLPEMPFLSVAANSRKIYRFEKKTSKSIIIITSLQVQRTGSSGMKAENGGVFVELNIESLRKELSASILWMTLGLLLSTSIVALIIFLIISRVILHPADTIIHAMIRRSNGDATSRVPFLSNDKIGAIALSLNEMLDELELESSKRNLIELQIRDSEAKLRELNANKNTFFPIIAHDLKSPFNSILGFSKLLQDEYDSFTPEEHKRFIKRINDGLLNVFKLLENLLEWSRVQLGRSEFNQEDVDIGLLSFEIINAHKLIFEKKHQQVSIQIPDNTMVHADQNMLRTIIRNLVSNAVKFSGENKTIRINTLATASANKVPPGFIGIRVTDEGVGIKEEDLGLLFRIDSGYRQKGTAMEGGTGLGLILCKEFVEKHKGIIWVESEAGKGSSFTFTVPLA
ncbi:MAG: HAMP domain-containing sensor histidine kinase, partial [Bacteroidetes bacterium]|nr:HAMP domain-containing sensor histidine kinase [Bacteroidota bacterium]